MSVPARPLVHPLPPDAGTTLGPICTLEQVGESDRWSHLPAELPIAASVASGVLGKAAPGAQVDRVVYASSVPLQVPHMGGFALSDALELQPGHIVDLGNHCAALLDAVWLGSTLWRSQSSLIVAPTELGRAVSDEMRAGKPGCRQWCDGAAAVLLGVGGERRLRPLAYVTAVAPAMRGMLAVRPKDGGFKFELNPEIGVQFRAMDMDTELAVVAEALTAADCQAPDLAGVVVVNRAGGRTRLIAPSLGIDPARVFSSREQHGHGGAADFLINLRQLMTDAGPGRHRALLIGNGLGYCWSALVVELRVPATP